MSAIPEKLKREILNDPYYKVCARRNGDCAGRITWEHAFIYAGRQINERWAIIPLCWYHHLGAGFNKIINWAIALSRATAADLEKYPNRDWAQLIQWLKTKKVITSSGLLPITRKPGR